jgi:multimeric flavodoxin WrbA
LTERFGIPARRAGMLNALALNCTLKADESERSSTDAMIAVLADAFAKHDVTITETVRVAALDIKPGVSSDEGDGDAWPALREKILAADILIFGGPIWMGQISSIAKRVLERMDAFISETDDQGRMPSYSKVAVAAIVGNEDGAHFSSAQLFQALNDVGYTVPAVAACYWVGEAMGSTDFQDLDKTPKKVKETAAMVAGNAAHLAGLLKAKPYPGER